MRGIRLLALAILVPTLAPATDFKLVPLALGSGVSISGRVTTDGSIGALSGGNITDWSIRVDFVTDWVYDRTNTTDISYQLSTDGTHLTLPTSPDGYTDGGLLGFYGSHYRQVRAADFTGAFASGGTAFWVYGSPFGYQPLSQPNGTTYTAGHAIGGNVFQLEPVDFGSGIVLSGTVETNGHLGPTSLVDWHLRVRETIVRHFDPANSHVMDALNLSTDGHDLVVTPFDPDGNPGNFRVGYGLFDPTAVFFGDYTWDPTGVSGYVDPFGLQMIGGLPLDPNGNYLVGTAPEPGSLAALLFGLALLRRRRR